jgi:hypothetical protein
VLSRLFCSRTRAAHSREARKSARANLFTKCSDFLLRSSLSIRSTRARHLSRAPSRAALSLEITVAPSHLSPTLQRTLPAGFIAWALDPVAHSIGLARCAHERPRLRCLAGPSPQANIDRRPHHPRQDIETRQSLPARSVRSGRVGHTDQAEELGSSRAQALARSGQEAAASNLGNSSNSRFGQRCCLEAALDPDQ